MKIKRTSRIGMNIFLVFSALLVLGLPIYRIFAQSETGLTPARVENIAVMPFLKGRNLSNMRETIHLYLGPGLLESRVRMRDADNGLLSEDLP